jgi:hypothetical protein
VPTPIASIVASAPVAAPASAPAPAPAPAVVAPEPTAPAPAAPTRLEADASAVTTLVQGPLTRSSVERGLSRLAPALRACYASAAGRAHENHYGAVDVTFIIDETGRAQSVDVGAAALPGLAECVRDSVRQVRTQDTPDVGVVHVSAAVRFTPPARQD